MPSFELFSAPIGTSGNAFLNWRLHSVDDIFSYAASYRNAAMNLIAFREQQDLATIDHAALPIIFLYRHAFELYLKTLIYRAATLTINEPEIKEAFPKLWREHSLFRLVQMANPILNEISTFPSKDDGKLIGPIGELAARIDEVDSGSYSFRYPITASGTSALPSPLLVNIFVFSETVEKVIDDLTYFCKFLENKNFITRNQFKLPLHAIASQTVSRK